MSYILTLLTSLFYYLLKLIPSLLGISIVLFLHELGHFIASRLLGVDVECLSVGIGPKLFSFHGKTEYRISLIPFGGYCRMGGSLDLTKALRDNKESLDVAEAGSYFGSEPFKRFIIFLAGPLANFLLAALLFLIAALIPTEHISNEAYITPVSAYMEVFHSPIKQESVLKGDLVFKADNIPISDWETLEDYLLSKEGDSVKLTILRDGKTIDVTIAPNYIDGRYSYGIANLIKPVIGRSESDLLKTSDIITEAYGNKIEWTYDLYRYKGSEVLVTVKRDNEEFNTELDLTKTLPFAWNAELRRYRDNINVFTYGFEKAAATSYTTLKALGALVTFQTKDAREIITGPMKAASTFGTITTLAFRTSKSSGVRALLTLLAFVSISISVGNLIPIPTFDGGGMLMSFAEMIKRKPLRPRTYVILQISGMIAAYAIIVFMYALDIKDMILK